MLSLRVIVSAMVLACVGAAPASSPFTAAGLPTDESFFPLAVWLQSPRNAERYKDLGINVYVALWRGPTAEQLNALARAGMYAVLVQNPRALDLREHKATAG